MVFFGPISSVYDFLTFYVLLFLLHAGQAEFHTGWFVESLATQTLVLFVIRTSGNPFRSRPSRALTATTLAIVLVGILLPYTPFAIKLGPRGVFLLESSGSTHTIPAFDVENVTDTTGAGDCWSAGLLAGLSENLPLPKAAQLANAVAACCIQSPGATSGVPALADVRKRFTL